MNAINIPTFLNIDLAFTLSGTARRFGAFFIDWIIKFGYVFFISFVFSIPIFSDSFLLGFVIYLPLFFYTFLLEWLFKGQTVGKKLMNIRVIGVDGNYPSVSQCAIRWMFLLADAYVFFLAALITPWFGAVSFLGPLVGALLIGLTKTEQRLGDIAAQTYVVSAKEDHFSIEDTIYSYANKRTNYIVKYHEVMKLSDKDMTIIKNLLEKSENQIDSDLANRLAKHVKKLLKIETEENDMLFLKNLLRDYNYLSINEK
ncbi:RDD family protein [Lacihabitans sp. LS3-19]|uniref:RDD family protein n=1 Tax=Lacihabitans sp. LS3-19 TaxID=2487335 RepID=UPI0020CDF198|nr:RDD family protein [Lacihabitans sp. LS3-19]MCP9768529.1 RDD family protein [Lacihabitans sp. LS3-19]